MKSSKPEKLENKAAGRTGHRLRPSVFNTTPPKNVRILLTIRSQLIAIFLIITLLPLAFMIYFFNRSTENLLRDSSLRLLLNAAKHTAGSIDDFFDQSSNAIANEASGGELIASLQIDRQDHQGSLEKLNELLKNLHQKQSIYNPYTQGYQLLNSDGHLLASTFPPEEENENLSDLLHHADPLAYSRMINTGAVYISPILHPKEKGYGSIYFASRINYEDEITLGILVAGYNAQLLQTIVEAQNERAGEGSYVILLDEEHIRLAHGSDPALINKSINFQKTEETDQVQTTGSEGDSQSGSDSLHLAEFQQGLLSVTIDKPFLYSITEREDAELFSGAAVIIQNRPWKVVFLQPESIFKGQVKEQTTYALLISVLFLIISICLAVIISRRLTSPVVSLTKAAERVTSGDLWVQAPVRRDEIGMLGNAFNNMTSELRRTLEGLEHRVAERTSELAKTSQQAKQRADQLQTIAEVAHTITSIKDQDTLLNKVTQLLSERFAFYHVGIFLTDHTGEYAVLQAANSEGGQHMLAKNHRLKVGEEGIVGYTVYSGKARIALDVGEDAVFFNNPDLPYTRSEMALPLKVGDKIIGALDVQSMEQAAFSDEDISILGTLADQVAVAIENVRLLSETQKALNELQTLHRQYLRHEWSQVFAEKGQSGFEYRFGKILPFSGDTADGVWKKLEESGQPVILTNEAEENSGSSTSLAAPITVRGQIIGYLNLEELDPDRQWTEDELNFLREVANQVGLAIENARLIEQTQQRAEREHLVTQITTRMRESSDPQTIVETAIHELKQALRVKQVQVFLPRERHSPDDKLEIEQVKGE
jgi:GAF domain-containing protein/HAMP domain-containing protein